MIGDYGDLKLFFRTPQCKGYRKANVNHATCYESPYQLFIIDLDK